MGTPCNEELKDLQVESRYQFERNKKVKTLKEYSKRDGEKCEHVQTTVNIECKQKEFIDGHNLNLSRMVRDMLAAFMAPRLLVKGKKIRDARNSGNF